MDKITAEERSMIEADYIWAWFHNRRYEHRYNDLRLELDRLRITPDSEIRRFADVVYGTSVALGAKL